MYLFQQVKLARDYEVYVSTIELAYIKNRWKSKPNEMVRRLMKLIVGEDKLRNMTPTGKSATSRIPKSVYNAVFGTFLLNTIHILTLNWYYKCSYFYFSVC